MAHLPEFTGSLEPSTDAAPSSQNGGNGGGDLAPDAPSSGDSAPSPTDKVLSGEAPESKQDIAQAIFDLNKAKTVMFEGKEWKIEDLKKQLMRHNDYTKKTQEIAKERETLVKEKQYASNLSADINYVIKNPHSIHEFKKIYPEQYHSVVENALRWAGGGGPHADTMTTTESQPSFDGLPPEFLREYKAMQEKLGTLEKSYGTVNQFVEDARIQREQALNSHLDSTFKRLSEKYPEGDQDVVLAKAEVMLRTMKDGRGITDEMWEKLWKNSHDPRQAKIDALKAEWEKGVSGKIKTQAKVNKAKADVPNVGVAAIQPPKQHRRMRDIPLDEILASME